MNLANMFWLDLYLFATFFLKGGNTIGLCIGLHEIVFNHSLDLF